jgi:hypothetical protein
MCIWGQLWLWSPLILWVQIPIRVRCTTLCDKVCQWLVTGRWFSPGPPVSSMLMIIYFYVVINSDSHVLFVCLMVFNTTFNNISAISWWSAFWWRKPEDPEKTTDLSQVTIFLINKTTCASGGSCGCDRHWFCEYKSQSGRGVQHYVIKFVSDLWQEIVLDNHTWNWFKSKFPECHVWFNDTVLRDVFTATFNNISLISVKFYW